MAAITPSRSTKALGQGKDLTIIYGTGTANQADTLTTGSSTPGGTRRLDKVTIAYSAAPTHAGATVTLDAGVGAAYDTTLATSDANTRYFVYIPDEATYLSPDDAIVVSAPAGGSAITASIQIYMEHF